jgi:hypothetical protein
VDGARDKFLAGACLAQNENGRVGGGDNRDLIECVEQLRTFADDCLETMLGSDLTLEVYALLGEFAVELFDGLKSQCIIDGDGEQTCDLAHQIKFCRVVCLWGSRCESQSSETASCSRKRQMA